MKEVGRRGARRVGTGERVSNYEGQRGRERERGGGGRERGEREARDRGRGKDIRGLE